MKNRKSCMIPHLTGGLNNQRAQVMKMSEELDHPVFVDGQNDPLSPDNIMRLYSEAKTPSDNRPNVKIFYIPNNEQTVRRNPGRPSKKKTNAREKYMQGLLGGKDGNDLLNLASKVGSRKAAVELLKSSGTKTPFNVEIPLGEEDEITSLKMQGLTPSNDALVDQAFRKKLEKTIISYLGSNENELKQLDKGVLITDEGIEDFRQMLTVYHLAHQMNTPLANAIKGHVPKSKSSVFDRLIPSFDDILAGENLVIFANNITRRPEAKFSRYGLPDSSDTLLPAWLDFARPNDNALNELKENLTNREIESFLEILGGGDLKGAFFRLLSNIRALGDIPINFLFRAQRIRQDDRQARLFGDLIENIVDALVSDYGRGRGYTNRKELAKAVVYASEEVYDKRVTDVFTPLRITVNAARRVRRFSSSGIPIKMGVDFATFDAGDVRGQEAVGEISPGMYYIGNFDFRIPPIGWNRKWMNATAQIIHEYWDYIRPSSHQAANRGFLPYQENQSLNLPQILYLIAIRTKELYNYDLAPEEWMTIIRVLGGENALTENYYTAQQMDIVRPIADLMGELSAQNEDFRREGRNMLAEIQGGRKARRRSANTAQSSLPQIYKGEIFNMKTHLEGLAKNIARQVEIKDQRSKLFRQGMERYRGESTKSKQEINDVLALSENLANDLNYWLKEHGDLVEKIDELQMKVDALEAVREKIGSDEKFTAILGRTLVKKLLQSINNESAVGLRQLAQDLGISDRGQKDALYKRIVDHVKAMTMEDEKGATGIADYIEKTGKEAVVEIDEKAEELEEVLETLDVKSELVESDEDAIMKADEETLAELGTPVDSDSDSASDILDAVDATLEKMKKAAEDEEDDWSDPENPPLPKNPVLNLGETGQIAVIGDTHGDHGANKAILDHINDNYPKAKVIWNGDKVDGRYVNYKGKEDDLKNLALINGLIESNPKKYFTVQGNHERGRYLQGIRFYKDGVGQYNGTGGFWGDMDDAEALMYEKEFAKQPVIAHAGPVVIVHGGLPKKFKRGWLKTNNWAKPDNIIEILWTRPKQNDEGQIARAVKAGFRVLITGHTPAIKFENNGMRKLADGTRTSDRGGPFISEPNLLGISTQSSRNLGLAYTLLDLDKETATVESFRANIEMGDDYPVFHSGTDTFDFPSVSIKRNPPGVVPMFGGMPDGVARNKGAVFSEVMIGRNVVMDVGEIGQSIYKGLVGGRTSLAEKRMAMALAVMQTELSERAQELGANAIANLRIDYEQPNSMNLSLMATGDAVKISKAALDKVKKNPDGAYHKHEKKVISILKKKGGAAGLKELRKAFPKGTTKAKAVGMLKKMNYVVLHQEGDYILIQGIKNPHCHCSKDANMMVRENPRCPDHARSNMPFDLAEAESAAQTQALVNVEGWAKRYIDDELQDALSGLGKNTGNLNYEISLKGEGNVELLEILKTLAPTAWPDDTSDLAYIDTERRFTKTQQSAQHSSLHKVAKELGRLYRNRVTEKPAMVKVRVPKGSRYFNVEFTSAIRKSGRKKPVRRTPKKDLDNHTRTNKSKRKNTQLPPCSYQKSKRSKPCGGKLRAKKNPKGRIICTDCGAEYEMRR